MNYSEFFEEDTNPLNLQTDFISSDDYTIIHKNTVIVCHDVFIRCTYNGVHGFLLVKRLNHPAKNIYWPIGGRILRGVTTEESLKKKARDECSLELSNITYIASTRTFFKEEPFGHAKGTDTLNLVFIADGDGELVLNKVHENPLIITQESYPNLRETLAPYVQMYLDYINEHNLW